MDQFKISIGPYELFSGFVSGLPLLLSLFVWYHPLFELRELMDSILQNSSLVMAFLVIIISYVAGGLISSFTWVYFKFIYRFFRFMIKREVGAIRRALLGSLEHVPSPLAVEQFLTMRFEDRLAYMIKRQYGSSKPAWAMHRIKPYLREYSPAISIMADSYLAIHIMYRNLSFGFLLLAAVLLRSVLMRGNFINEHVAYMGVIAIFSIAAFQRALAFSHWCDREILLGFYNVVIKHYLRGDDFFAAAERNANVTGVILVESETTMNPHFAEENLL